MSQSSNNLAAYSWSIADLLRGDFKQSQYGRIILPFTLLRRLECVLAPSKSRVLAEVDKLATMNLPEEVREIFEYFNFSEFVGQINDANLLYKMVQRVRLSDLM